MARSPPFSLLADRCASMRQLKQVHAQMLISGRVTDNFAASRLVSFAALHPFGDLSHALSLLLHHAVEPNSFMWNTLIRAAAQSNDPSNALFLFADMRRHSGAPPGKHTFPFLLKASATLRSLTVTRHLHCLVLKHGLGENHHVVNGLIRSYSASGNLLSARKVFDESPEINSTIWTTMVSGYAQNLLSDEAIELFQEAVRAGIEPCGATLASALSACTRVYGGLRMGCRIHTLIREKGIKVGVILGTALVDMYVKNGALSSAIRMFEEMPDRNTATWNAIICGAARHGHADTALRLFWEMKDEKVEPNEITFVGVLSACCHAGWVELGLQVFESMAADYKVEPKLEHLGCMVDLLGRSGRLSEAEKMIAGSRWKADVVVLGALLTACRNYGNVKVAERVAEEVRRVEPDNHGALVVLSNMYAETGRWEDVARLRRSMRHGGLKKTPAWSYV